MNKELWLNDEKALLKNIDQVGDHLSFHFDSEDFHFKLIERTAHQIILEREGQRFWVPFAEGQFLVRGSDLHIVSRRDSRKKGRSREEGDLTSPMPGKILKIIVSEGEKVESGDSLLVMEAMKMEHTVKSPCGGIVKKVLFKEGEQIEGGVELVVLTPTQERPGE